MFSIPRYQGDNDQDEEHRSYEKKQERLKKLLERTNRKRKSPAEKPVQENIDTAIVSADPKDESSTETKQKKIKKQKKKGKHEHMDDMAIDNDKSESAEMDASLHEQNEEASLATNDKKHRKKRKEALEEEMEEDTEVENAIPMETEAATENINESHMLEEFPDLLGSKSKASKEETQLLRDMGIPEWLLQPTTISPSESCALDQAGLSSRLIERCTDLGLTSLFAVQKKVIPTFLRHRTLYDTKGAASDLCISAPTGSGKTLAYVLPIVDILSKRVVTRLRALVILPTRDLVLQVKETFDAFVKGTDLKVATATGQQSFAHEQHMLVDDRIDSYPGGKSRVDILIVTPGRLMDHLKATPNFSLQHLRFLVIDEADRLLSQSYQDWLNKVLLATRPSEQKVEPLAFKTDKASVTQADAISPAFLKSFYDLPATDLDLSKTPSVQKLLFSATLTKDPAKIAGLHLNNPEYISVQAASGSDRPSYTTPEGLQEYTAICSTEKKPLMVLYLLRHLGLKSCLCFTKSVESTRRLQMLIEAFEALQGGSKIRVADFSSDLNASQRKILLKQFRNGEIDLLICSDLIGRGIDLDNVEAVISYDMPPFIEKYIHRVGRTARAGRKGQAYTLLEKQEAGYFKKILNQAGHGAQVTSLKVDKDKLHHLQGDYDKALASLSTVS